MSNEKEKQLKFQILELKQELQRAARAIEACRKIHQKDREIIIWLENKVKFLDDDIVKMREYEQNCLNTIEMLSRKLKKAQGHIQLRQERIKGFLPFGKWCNNSSGLWTNKPEVGEIVIAKYNGSLFLAKYERGGNWKSILGNRKIKVSEYLRFRGQKTQEKRKKKQ